MQQSPTIREWYTRGGLNHGIGEATVLHTDAKTGVITLEQYHRDNMLHRLDGPAEIKRDAQTGLIIHEAYFRNDELQFGKNIDLDFPSLK